MPVSGNVFQKIPFIRITSLFLAGILLSDFLNFASLWIGVLLFLLISVLIFGWRRSNYTLHRIQNALISVCIVLSGVIYPHSFPEKLQPGFENKDYFLAEVCQKPAEKAKTFQTILRIRNKTLIHPEMVTAFFSKENFDSTITTGDQLALFARPQEISNPGNPFEIDYRKIMHQRGIWFSVYLDKGTYLKTGHHSYGLMVLAEKTRDRLITLLTTVMPQREERSVVSALTLGYRSEIDQDTLNYFASTGAMHVLSVSGLHVALIYFILGFLFSFLKRGKTGSVIFYIVMILFLWIYAFLTGFSPAVQRATVMFTFVILGNSLRRPVNIYNSLTASVLFLILLSPNVLLDIGFQLSYLAVLGIVIIQPALNGLLEITNPFLKWCWSLFTVSVAAQIITFPLCIFYFNQFPNFFWLSSYAVIPITTLIIWLTMAFFVISPIHGFALFIGMLIQKITYVMLYLLKAIDASPLALTKGIVINLPQVYLLFGCISAIIIFLYSKKKVWLYATLTLLLLFQIIELQEKGKVYNQNIVWIYNTKSLMIHLINGRNNYLITNASEKLSETELKMLERVCSHRKLDKTLVIPYEPSRSVKLRDLILKDNCLEFANSRIRLISSNKYRPKPDQIELTIFPGKTHAKSLTRIICLRKPGLTKTKGTDMIQEGAFYADLRRE